MEKQQITTALLNLHQKIESKLGKEKAFREAVKILKNLIKCDGCAIILFEGKKARVVAESGFSRIFKTTEFSKNQPAINYIIKTGKSIYTGDTEQGKFKRCVPSGCMMKSLICIPLKIKGKTKGIIHIDSFEKNKFTKEDVNFAKLLAAELSEILETSLLYSKMEELASIDPLTGCLLRRNLYRDLQKEIVRSERYNKSFSIIMIDVDNFKKYNDKFGHQKGDLLLKKITKKIKDNLRKVDSIYRFGGDEFIVILPETDKKGAEKFCERIKKEIAKIEIKAKDRIQITISTGIATFPEHGKKPKELIEKADQKMYAEKFRKATHN